MYTPDLLRHGRGTTGYHSCSPTSSQLSLSRRVLKEYHTNSALRNVIVTVTQWFIAIILILDQPQQTDDVIQHVGPLAHTSLSTTFCAICIEWRDDENVMDTTAIAVHRLSKPSNGFSVVVTTKLTCKLHGHWSPSRRSLLTYLRTVFPGINLGAVHWTTDQPIQLNK